MGTKHFVCAVRDIKVGSYGRPIFAPSTGVAVRSFTDEACRDAEDNVMFKHPADFEFYYLGIFDEEDGSFAPTGSGKPEFLVSAVSVRNSMVANDGR